MAEIPERDAALLLDMLFAARDALEFADGLTKERFLSSRLHQNAIIRSLEVIGEAAGQVSPDSVAKLPQIPWREVTGMRHRLIHGYAVVDLDLVWQVVTEKIDPLIERLTPLIPTEDDDCTWTPTGC
jgi:uncharacterized protein with HEPN domain